MMSSKKSNDNLTMLDRLKIANALLDLIDCKSNNLDDLLFYTFRREKKVLLPDNIKKEYVNVTENYIKGITCLIKEVSELPVVDWMYKWILYIFVLKSLLRILVGFLKHTKAVKYRIVCYNDCKDY